MAIKAFLGGDVSEPIALLLHYSADFGAQVAIFAGAVPELIALPAAELLC